MFYWESIPFLVLHNSVCTLLVQSMQSTWFLLCLSLQILCEVPSWNNEESLKWRPRHSFSPATSLYVSSLLSQTEARFVPWEWLEECLLKYLRSPELRENRHIDPYTLLKGVPKILPLSLVLFSGYKLNLLSKTSKQYCWVATGFVTTGSLKDIFSRRT